jgi:hypothetical protein
MIRRPADWIYDNALSNAQIQKYGSAVCFLASRYYDATADAVAIQGRNIALYPNGGYKIHGNARYERWHFYKNNAVWLLMAACVLKGLEVGQDHTSMPDMAIRTVSECAIAWDIWQWRKHYVLSGNAFDYRAGQNRHLFVLPLPTSDRYIGMSGSKIAFVQGMLFTFGTYGFIIN